LNEEKSSTVPAFRLQKKGTEEQRKAEIFTIRVAQGEREKKVLNCRALRKTA